MEQKTAEQRALKRYPELTVMDLPRERDEDRISINENNDAARRVYATCIRELVEPLEREKEARERLLQELVDALRTADIFDPDYAAIAKALASAKEQGFTPLTISEMSNDDRRSIDGGGKDTCQPHPMPEQTPRPLLSDQMMWTEAADLAIESTAPDKETPDWMIADIQRGMKFARDFYEQARKEDKERIRELEDLLRRSFENLSESLKEEIKTMMDLPHP